MLDFTYRTMIAALSLGLACTPKPDDGDDTTGNDSSETLGPVVTSTDTPTGSTTTEATDTGDTPTEPPTTGTTDTTTGTSTAGPPATLPEACAATCDAQLACELLPPEALEQCNIGCNDAEQPGTICAGLLAELWTCVAGLSCADLEQFVHVEPTTCLDQVFAHDDACHG